LKNLLLCKILLDEDIKINNNIPIFDLELIDSHTHTTYSSLSNGEKNYIRYITESLFHYDAGHLDSSYKIPDIFLLDEAETSFHPNLQKNLIKDSITLLKGINQTIHLIYATHSPFLLSDLPKENVIFLKKDKDGKCQNVSDIINIETFGANIHTLLSHGFFMNGGLMGEFAKSKIEEIKKFYELVQKMQTRMEKIPKTKELIKKSFERRKTRFHNIQKIIGEPFLKTVMKNYLDELEILFYEKKEFLDKEILRLQKLREQI
jgi:predicted ATP-binding protein involved in virulence